MNQNANFSSSPTTKSDRKLIKWSTIPRFIALVVLAGVSTGCADDVVMRNPQTGQTETCRESMQGLDPWSQKMSCVADHEAQGWTRVGQE